MSCRLQVHLLYLILSLFSFSFAQSQISLPGTVPLAIRSPYFNCWNNASTPMRNWPTFWNGQILGWVGFVRVDGQLYQFQGAHKTNPPTTNVTSLSITPTRTVYVMQAGPMNLTITYLTPIEPSDPIRQSIPFSYLSLEATAIDGQSHNLQVYSDISAEWASGNSSEFATWNTTKTDSSTFHQIQLQTPSPLMESGGTGHAEDATVYYAMRSRPDMTVKIDTDDNSRGQFSTSGSLTVSSPPSSGVIGPPFYVFAISVDLGNIQKTTAPVVWSVGVVRNPSVSYTAPTGEVQSRVPYFLAKYGSVQSAIDNFLSDFDDASQRATAFDQKIKNATSSFTADYFNLVSLAARQTIGATELTISNGTDGKYNMSDVKMFMKDVGSSRRVNPVETLYASFPFFLYLNASYAGHLLSPLLEYQDSPQYAQPFAAQDLGTNYPIATGNNQPHSQGVEQSGNMLIMALAHARTSGDGTLISRHYGLLRGWADYLGNNTLASTHQVTADLESQPNITNLAIKGIIGIKAMSEISRALGKFDDSQRYSSLASTLSATWTSVALSTGSPQHVLWDYGDESSWAQTYNLYADKLLGTNLIDSNIYDLQTQYYNNLITSTTGVATQFGLPIDSSITSQTNSAWTMFTAATATNTTVRNILISPISAHAALLGSYQPFPNIYKLDNTGSQVTGASSPAQGAMFAPLALSVSNTTIIVLTQPGSSKSSIVGPVVGGVLGGLALLALIVLAFFFVRRRRLRRQFPEPKDLDMMDASEVPVAAASFPYEYTPYDPAYPNNHNTQTTEVTMVPPIPTGYSKSREAMMNSQPYVMQPGASAYSGSSSSAPASSREPPTEIVSPVTQISQTDVVGLRTEVENLRRVMQEIQAERIEAPPVYAD